MRNKQLTNANTLNFVVKQNNFFYDITITAIYFMVNIRPKKQFFFLIQIISYTLIYINKLHVFIVLCLKFV